MHEHIIEYYMDQIQKQNLSITMLQMVEHCITEISHKLLLVVYSSNPPNSTDQLFH